jgi:hypothetical protein
MTDLAKFVVFKPVPGGYVYAPPTAWLFGSRKFFLVTEDQKAALLALYTASSQLVLWTIGISWIALTALLGTALSLWAQRFGYDVLGLLGLIVMIATVVSIYPAFVAGRYVLLQRLGPILTTLPPTKQRITALEERQALKAAGAGQAAALSPARRRIVRIASLVAMVATFVVMISRAIDSYGADHLNFVTLYLANANPAGVLSTVVIVSMGSLLVIFARNSPQA